MESRMTFVRHITKLIKTRKQESTYIRKTIKESMIKHFSISLTVAATLALLSCTAQTSKNQQDLKLNLAPPSGKAMAAFAEGCFWCSEHIFEAVVGVDSAVSGYAGGKTINPTYQLVNTETTGHAETVLVYYDPNVVSYAELLNVFFTSQDPTTPEQQGPDRGNSYRSIIFYSTPEEKELAEKAKVAYGPSFKKPIVSEIKPLTAFYKAEDYHQNYIEQNPYSSYVMGVSIPRYKSFEKTYKGKLKSHKK
jgi:peptide-methionine (S)-S-oxide reductase